MRVCDKCGVFVRGERQSCPLCQRPLSGDPGGEPCAYPVIPEEGHPFQLLLRLAVFLSVAAGVVCVAVNAMLPRSGYWSVFPVAGIACTWLILWIGGRKLGNIPKSILWQVVVVSLLAVLWDRFTGRHGWSLDYVLPALFVAAMAAMAVIARLLRLRAQDYMIYLVTDALLGVAPVVFYACGWLRVVYPSLICVAVSLISLTALIVFEGVNMRAELRRHLHL